MNSASGPTQRGVVFDSVLDVDHFSTALTVQAQRTRQTLTIEGKALPEDQTYRTGERNSLNI